MMSKTVLITGASKGIGASTAIYFAKKGYNVAINYFKSENNALEVKETIISNGGTAQIYKADVSKSYEVSLLIENVIADFGFIDVLVNNAGVSQQKLFTQTTDDEWFNLLNTNLSSMFFTSRKVLEYMIREHRGNIINISSIWGLSGASMEVCYSTTKGGVIALTKALSKEVAPSGIRVNCIAPGVINTDMCANLGEDTINVLIEETPLNCLGQPLDIAKAIYFLASDNSKFITGQTLTVDGGFL